MKSKRAFCLFEQSGTFKNEFIKLGIPAEDYDILDDFGQTDHKADLFAEIDKAYNGDASLFDGITPEDLIIAFYPCTRFECQISMAFRGEQYQARNMSDASKIEYAMRLHDELHDMYKHICKLFVIALKRGLPLIVENPFTQPHYLTSYFPVKPSVIDNNRKDNGDYYKKPTQYWFVNIKPNENCVFEPLELTDMPPIEFIKSEHCQSGGRKVARSLIHPQYARRFILSHILD